MPLDFNFDRWEKVRADARRWWAGDLDRPLIQYRLTGRDPGRAAPRLAKASRDTTAYDLSVSPEEIVDCWDHDLCRLTYLGDAFPCVWPDFGAGVLAAFLGARPEPGNGTVWFHPPSDREISELEFQYVADSVWLRRIRDICRCAQDRWQGMVQVGMTDLGGNLDILSTFRPSQQLLLDLYDHPAEVKRLSWETHELWWRYFEQVDRVLQPRNPGYTAWTPIYSETPSYMLQCDFCAMISPAMFDEFVKPELAASCRRLGNAFYHLDGPGQLPHLDSLLEIKELKGVQWIPGAGQPGVTHWPEVYRKIRAAGKLIQSYGTESALDTLVRQLGSGAGIVHLVTNPVAPEDQARAFLRRYGA